MQPVILFLLAASMAVQTTIPRVGAGGGRETRSAQGTFIALSVADIERMSAWYREALSLKVTGSGEAPDKSAKFAILEGDGVIIEMVQHSKAKPRRVAESYQLHGIFKAGMIVTELDATYRRMKELKVEIAHGIMPAENVSMRSFIVKDPEGNLLQFFGK